MKLHGDPRSGCTRKVLVVAAEKGVVLPVVAVDLGRGEHRLPGHRRLHPFGQIPVLDDGGFLLYESLAIMRYLDATLPGPALTPHDARARALMDQWLSVEASYPRRDGDLRVLLDALERALENRRYLAGHDLSLADVAYAPLLPLLRDAGQADRLARRSNVAVWAERLLARPSWQWIVASPASA